jgi:hypothetical protein
MSINRESLIRILRSTTTDVPAGLTFGELAFSDLHHKLFVGDINGNSIWIGGEVTGGDIANNNAYMVPTQSAVKGYVDGLVGGGSVVNSVNATAGAITITGDGGAISNVQVGKANTITARLAGTGVTGVASFSSGNFDVDANGQVSIKTDGVSNSNLVNDSITVTTSTGLAGGATVALGSSITLTNIGVVSLNGLTGARSLTGDGGAISGVGNDKITARAASTSLTGVAYFSSNNFDVDGNGLVTVKNGGITNGNLQNSSVTVSAGPGLDGGGTVQLGNTITINNNGVRSFNGATGAVTFSVTGDGGALFGTGNGTSTSTITARVATASLTGVASFNGSNFNIGTSGNVEIKAGGVSNNNLAFSAVTVDAGGSSTLSLGNTLTLTGGAQNNIVFSNSGNTVTATLADNVTISGNLTVNGQVVTANVDTFTVEDSLIMLATGNNLNSLDIGFFGQYAPSGVGVQFTGLFRDADDGKWNLFTGLTSGSVPGTTVNKGGAGYTVATLIANIDGGTF